MPKSYFKSNFVLFLIILLFLLFAGNVFRWVIDDLYIYFRYANNFVNGNGIVYNPGEYVEGFSSFTWFLFLSFFRFTGIPLEMSAKIAGLIFTVPSIILFYKICICENLGRLSLLAVALMVFNLSFILWSVSGFEIMFYIFLLLYVFYRIITFRDNNNFLLLAVLIFFISITRPEGILFSIVFLFFFYNLSQSKSNALKTSLAFAILFFSFLVFRYYYFGDIFPNTYYAKAGQNIFGEYELRSYKKGILYILDFFKHNPQFLLFVFLIPFSFRKLLRNKVFLFALVVISVQFFFIIYAGGDWMVQYRFVTVAVPFLSLTIVICLKQSSGLLGSKSQVLYFSIVVILIFLSLTFSDYKIINKETELWNNVKKLSPEIEKIIPVNSLVANGSSGIIPFYLENVNFLDIVGLTNKHIALNGFRRGNWFEKSLPDYVYGNKPGWLILWKKKDFIGNYTFENASPCYLDMAQNKDFLKYSLSSVFDVSDDIRIELYKINEETN